MNQYLRRVNRRARGLMEDALSKGGLTVTRAVPWGDNTSVIGTVIDVGCAWGTKELLKEYPHTPFVLIDPLVEYRQRMEEIVSQRGGHVFNCGVGSLKGSMDICVETELLETSSLAFRTPLTAVNSLVETRTIAIETVDELIGGLDLEEPFLMKIDTEGWELEVLRGATETLKRTRFLITETSIAPRFVDGYRFIDLVSEVSARGFDLDTILTARADRNHVVRFADLRFRNNQI